MEPYTSVSKDDLCNTWGLLLGPCQQHEELLSN